MKAGGDIRRARARTLLAAGTAALAVAALASQAQAVVLRYTFTSGEAHRYKDTFKMRGELRHPGLTEPERSEESSWTLHTRKVLSVSGDGETADVEDRVTAGETVTVEGGQTTTEEEPRERTVMSVNRRGKVLKVKSTTPEEDEEPADESAEFAAWEDALEKAFEAALVLPDRDLKPGDTWTADAAAASPDGGKSKVVVRLKLLETLTHRGRSCAKIQGRFEVPLDLLVHDIRREMEAEAGAEEFEVEGGGKMWGDFIWYFDYVNGWDVEQTVSAKFALKVSLSLAGYGPLGEMSASGMFNVKSVMLEARGAAAG